MAALLFAAGRCVADGICAWAPVFAPADEPDRLSCSLLLFCWLGNCRVAKLPVGLQHLLPRALPIQFLADAPQTGFSHSPAATGIVKQFQNRIAKLDGIVLPHIHRGIAG